MNNIDLLKTCPIEISLELITKKWIVLIIRDLLFGKSKFNEFKENKPELTNKVLSRCLKQMEDDGLIVKIINPENIRDTEYKLTEKGIAMNKIIYELAAYIIDTDQCRENLNDVEKNEVKDLFRKNLNLND